MNTELKFEVRVGSIQEIMKEDGYEILNFEEIPLYLNRKRVVAGDVKVAGVFQKRNLLDIQPEAQERIESLLKKYDEVNRTILFNATDLYDKAAPSLISIIKKDEPHLNSHTDKLIRMFDPLNRIRIAYINNMPSFKQKYDWATIGAYLDLTEKSFIGPFAAKKLKNAVANIEYANREFGITRMERLILLSTKKLLMHSFFG